MGDRTVQMVEQELVRAPRIVGSPKAIVPPTWLSTDG